jgi:hypothetical protein
MSHEVGLLSALVRESGGVFHVFNLYLIKIIMGFCNRFNSIRRQKKSWPKISLKTCDVVFEVLTAV